MTRSPLTRACAAMRLPRGLYLLRGDLPLSDAEIRANLRHLRQRRVAAERLVSALTLMFNRIEDDERDDCTKDGDVIWEYAQSVMLVSDLPPSMIGVLVALAMLPEEGAIEPSEWSFVVEAAP